MGHVASKGAAKLAARKEVNLLLVGLDAAGKTTLLYKLKLGETQEQMPTLGHNVEELEYKGIKFIINDLGGQDKIRTLWKHYYSNIEGIIFVVDSNDPERLDEKKDYKDNAKVELHRLLDAEELKGAPLLVYANKQDVDGAMKKEEITDRLNLKGVKNRKWLVQGCCAQTGDGIFAGFDWLYSTITKKR